MSYEKLVEGIEARNVDSTHIKIVNGKKYFDYYFVSQTMEVDPKSVSRIVKRGGLKAVQLGKKKWVPEESLNNYLNP